MALELSKYGILIKGYQDKTGLTLQEISLKLECSVQTLKNWRFGLAEPTTENVEKINQLVNMG